MLPPKGENSAADRYGETVAPEQYATGIRPDQQPLIDNPTAANFEFYSQKNGTPLRRANLDSVGINYRPGIISIDSSETGGKNAFFYLSDSSQIVFRDWYGTEVQFQASTAGVNIYNTSDTITENRRAGVDGSAMFWELINGGEFNVTSYSGFSTNPNMSIGPLSSSIGGGNNALTLYADGFGGIEFIIGEGNAYIYDATRPAKKGLEYQNSSLGADFTDGTLIHRAYAAQMISDSMAAGGGTVTDFSAGNLSPLFTASVATPTTTPALSFALSNANANTFLAGPTSGGAAAPTYRALVNADLPVGSGGAFKDGGNTFGATGVLGTNDANGLNIETNNVVRASVTGGSSTGGAWTVTDVTASTNTSTDNVVTYQCNSTGTPATNYGYGILFQGESSTTDSRDMARIYTSWTTATDGTRSANFKIASASSGVLSDIATFSSSGGAAMAIGNCTYSGTSLAASAAYTLRTTATNGVINIGSTSVNQSSTRSISINSGTGVNKILTTLDMFDLATEDSYVVASGSGRLGGIAINNSYTLTGTASGTQIGIDVNPTIVSLANGSYVGVNIPYSNSAAMGINQTGASTNNYFAGNTGFDDATPETPLDVAGTAAVIRLIGQDNTPTISAAAGAGSGASASIVGAQSSDLAGRFTVTSGTSATSGLWATITFGSAYAVAPVVVLCFEDADAATGKWYVNVSTTGFEVFLTGSAISSTSHDFAYHVIGGK